MLRLKIIFCEHQGWTLYCNLYTHDLIEMYLNIYGRDKKLTLLLPQVRQIKCHTEWRSQQMCSQHSGSLSPSRFSPSYNTHTSFWTLKRIKCIFKNKAPNFLVNTVLCHDSKPQGLLKAVNTEQFSVILSYSMLMDLRTSIHQNTEVCTEWFLGTVLRRLPQAWADFMASIPT